ncbi:MAG: hypothetical protein JNK19_06590 [Tabrizicola sp.]|nr:hypothetical protein [Tabrizicola sp.]
MKLGSVLTLVSGLALLGCSYPLEGGWAVTANCPADSAFGALVIRAKATATEVQTNEFVGEITNDLGQRGQFRASLQNNLLLTETNWDGLPPTTSRLTLDRSSGSFTGVDSMGCSLIVVRP